jgi:hypothetical protein
MDMKVQTIINGWSVLQTGVGVACKYVRGNNEYEVCLSFVDGEVHIEVHQEGFDEPVATLNLTEDF